MSCDFLMECGGNGWGLAQGCVFPGEHRSYGKGGEIHFQERALTLMGEESAASEVHRQI